jgi:hypothetical protein
MGNGYRKGREPESTGNIAGNRNGDFAWADVIWKWHGRFQSNKRRLVSIDLLNVYGEASVSLILFFIADYSFLEKYLSG